jgi:DNA-damage-inducible protein D
LSACRKSKTPNSPPNAPAPSTSPRVTPKRGSKSECAASPSDELTGEWKKRGVKEKLEYSILTAEISKAAFGLTPSEYAAHKGLKRQNLRDHMTDLELIFSMLGEAATTEITRTQDAQGFPENKAAAQQGGTVAGNARRDLEKKSGRKIVTRENYLDAPESTKRLTRKPPR